MRIPLSGRHAHDLRVYTLNRTQNFTVQSQTRKADHTTQTRNRKLLIDAFVQTVTQRSGSGQRRGTANVRGPPLCHTGPGGVNLKRPGRQGKAATPGTQGEVRGHGIVNATLPAIRIDESSL